MAWFMPGASPPLVITAIRFIMIEMFSVVPAPEWIITYRSRTVRPVIICNGAVDNRQRNSALDIGLMIVVQKRLPIRFAICRPAQHRRSGAMQRIIEIERCIECRTSRATRYAIEQRTTIESEGFANVPQIIQRKAIRTLFGLYRVQRIAHF